MEPHEEFTQWATTQGVKINGVAVHKFPGRGLGIIAEKKIKVRKSDLDAICAADFLSWGVYSSTPILSCESILTICKAGDIVLNVPISALRSALTVPKSISQSIGAITVHGLLAADLTMDSTKARAPWLAVLPTKSDFDESTPIMWHPALQTLLPPAALSLLKKQQTKFLSDWTAVSAAFPSLSRNIYLYNWLLINTRTFYYTFPKLKAKKPLHRDDCLALIPFADYFNHADVGCEVGFSSSGYTICADREIEEGEEMHISYGNHSNDFLLAEYGFILEENKWDEVSLDEVILPLFSDEQKNTLKEAGFLGNFLLDKETVCYRLQVALRLLCTTSHKWQRLVASGLEIEDQYQVKANGIQLKALKIQCGIIKKKLTQVKTIDCGLSSQKETLCKRWKQIDLLIAAAIDRIER